MATKKIVTPTGQGYEVDIPDEGKLWRDNSGNIFTVKSGQIAQVNAGDIVAQKYLGKSLNQLDMRPRGEGGTGEWDALMQRLGIGRGKTLEQEAQNILGIDISKLPEYNLGDVERIGGFKYAGGGLTGEEAKQLYAGGSFAAPAGTPKEIFGADIPKIITGGEGGQVYDSQGNPIKPEDYAKYGITDTRAVAPTYQTTGQTQTSYWKSPSGTVVGVPIGSEAENNFKNLGWTQSTAAEEQAGRVQTISDTGEIKIEAPAGGQVGGTVNGQATTQNTQWVNDLYQKYFDRPATQAELDNWGKETPQNLESFLKQEAQRYGYTSKAFQTEESQRLQNAYDKIDGSNLPPELKQLYKDVVKNYPPGIEFDANEILNTFEKIKNETIDPQYRNYVAQAEKELTQNLADIEQQRALELEQERSVAGQAIRQAKEGLEKAGMTFTGKAIETLGAEAAIPQGATGAETTPKQEPFGGYFYEGTVPQYNRLSSSSTQARYESALKSLGLQAEQQLGTTGVSKFGISGYTPVGGTTGTLEEQKKQTEASTLQQLLNNYQQKQQSLTNINFSS